MEQIYFIVNLQAKNGRCRKVWITTEKELKKRQMTYQAFYTDYTGHATEMARSIVKNAGGEPALIIAVGGDGTLHEIVNGVLGNPNIAIGFIPGGSGNDFSRGFDVPKDPNKALELILDKRSLIKIDAGKISHDVDKETFFINNMGAGFDAVICKEANESKIKARLNLFSLGRLVYVFILIKKLVTYKCSDMEMQIDGNYHKLSNVWFVTVSNQTYYGGGMKIAPVASATDGLLDITVVRNLSRWKLLFVFITVFWGGHTRFKEVSTFIGKTVSIQSKRPVLVHADGEVIGHTPLMIQACGDALNIITGKKGIEDRAG